MKKRTWWYLGIFAFILLPVAELLGLLRFLDRVPDKHITDLNAACIIILTFAIAYIAWNQLNRIRKTAKADFLIRIDSRYGSRPIIKARVIIHRLYLKAGKQENICKKEQDMALSHMIRDLYENEEAIEDFIYVLNFFELLETIAYFANKHYLSTIQVNELLGGSIEYFHRVFIPLRDFLRQEYEDDDYYHELDDLIKRMKSEIHLNRTC